MGRLRSKYVTYWIVLRTEQVPITLLLLVVIEEYVIIISLDHIGNMVFTFVNLYIISALKFFTTIFFCKSYLILYVGIFLDGHSWAT